MLVGHLISNRSGTWVPARLWWKLEVSPLTAVEFSPLPLLQQGLPRSIIGWLWTLVALVLWTIERFQLQTRYKLQLSVCAALPRWFLRKAGSRTWKFGGVSVAEADSWQTMLQRFPGAAAFPARLPRIQSLDLCFTPSPGHHGQAKWLVTPAPSGTSRSPLRGMRLSFTKKAELMFPRSKEKGRGLSRVLSLPVVSSRLAVNLGCLLDPKLSLHVHRKTDASHSWAPCSSQARSAKLAGRVHNRGSRDSASCLRLLWAGNLTLSVPHISLASLPGYQAGSQRAACFSRAVGTAAASAHKQGTEAGACERFGSNSARGAWTRELGREPGIPEPEQVGALTTRLPFIFQH